jgi:polysaccharide export outer membrane protein
MHLPYCRATKLTLAVGMLMSCLEVNAFSQSPSLLPLNATSPPPMGGASATYPSSTSAPMVQPSIGTPQLTNVDQSHYIISSGDMVEITVFNVPNLSQRTPVNASGEVYMPLVNYVHIAGFNTEGAQGAIERALLSGGFLKAPHVTVAVVQYAGGVVLMGEISKPGIYPVMGTDRLFDIMTEAGGVTGTAGQAITITHRDGAQTTVLLSTNPKLQMEADVPLIQGDTVIVSKAGVVYVVGEVLNPSGFVMDEKGQYTVMKLVAMAHGTTRLAKTSKARIVRRTADGQKEIPVPLDKILISKVPDIPLEPNDILFIPINGAKKTAERSAEVAVSLATALTVIGAEHF